MRFAPGVLGRLNHLLVGHVRAAVIQTAQPGHIGDGFKIENQCRNHRPGKYDKGLTGVPWRRISKCRRGDVVSVWPIVAIFRSEEHTSELQSLMRISYAVFCLKK